MAEKKTYRHITEIVLWSLLVLIITVGLIAATYGMIDSSVKDVSIQIDVLEDGSSIINPEDVQKLINETYAQDLIGKSIEKIDVKGLEEVVNTNPFVREAQVYFDKNARLTVNVKQRQPLARIFRNGKSDFYIDKEGILVPVHTSYPVRMLIIRGLFNGLNVGDTIQAGTDLYEVFDVVKYINQDDFVRAYIDELHVELDGTISMLPKLGEFEIVLDSSEEIEEKLNRLKIFLKEVVAKGNWDTYKSINIEYDNQVVASKK